MVIGILSYLFGLKKSFFPERDPRNITISVVFPGASPEEVEEGVITKIEENLSGLSGIERIKFWRGFVSGATRGRSNIRTGKEKNIDNKN